MNQTIDTTISKAREAFEVWAPTSLDARVAILNAFAEQLRARRDELREIICRETGKPRWDSSGEVEAMINKVAISIDAQRQRRSDSVSEAGAVRYRPHGVVAVLGPFNFPGHLPNGHIVPALLAGNVVVFKPSELTPLTAEKTLELWRGAGLPEGVLQVVNGGREVGEALVRHPGVDGVFFTGSFAAGRAINRALADFPGKIAALEMGGNNPLVVHRARDVKAAAYLTIQSAFISSGQRCSCARRLIVTRGNDRFIDELMAMTKRVVVGRYTDEPEPFMGPVINAAAAEKLLIAQVDLLNRGGEALVEMRPGPEGPGLALLTPGIIDVSGVVNRRDEEHFGPLLQLIRVRDLEEAIVEANRTQYGLAAGILTDDRAAYEKFFAKVRAGVVNWNRALTGASSKLPFGGICNSGNHRPSAAFACDYASYPVASMESEKVALPAKLSPGIEIN